MPRGGLRGTGVPGMRCLPVHSMIQEMPLLGVFLRNGEWRCGLAGPMLHQPAHHDSDGNHHR
jgi:hypothetical protein